MWKKFKRWLASFGKKEEKKPAKKPDVKPTETEKKNLLDELVKVYAETDIEFNNLKEITIAQWMLESGRGSSKLAQEHNNFAGLKWRDEMKSSPGASEISYEAHDGETGYCKFDSIESFIKGYWHFLDRNVYDGWKWKANSPKDYLRFIIDAGYCPDNGYYNKVIALLPEATDMLEEEESEPRRDNADTNKPDDGGEYTEYPEDEEKLYYPKAIRSDKKMRTRGSYKDDYPQGAVVHYTSGRSRTKETGGSRSTDTHRQRGESGVRSAAKKGAYCYFIIDRDGTVYQNFPLNRWGHHAGDSSWKGLSGGVSNELVGIEIQSAGKVKKKGDEYVAWFTKTSSGDKTFKEDEVRYSKDSRNIQEGYYHKFSKEQEEGLQELLLWLKRNNPDVFDLDLVVGHDEVAPKRKADPGASLSLTMPGLRSRLKKEYDKRY